MSKTSITGAIGQEGFPEFNSVSIKQNDNSLNGKNINIFAEMLENNPNLKIGQVLKADDGGHISIFKDAQGRTVGSVNFRPDGTVRNFAFEKENGDSYSYNDLDKDGIIDNGIFEHIERNS